MKKQKAIVIMRLQIGLGDDLLNILRDYYAKLSDNPYLYSFIEHSEILRDVKIDRFPYVVIYLVSGDEVIIVSVRNTRNLPFI